MPEPMQHVIACRAITAVPRFDGAAVPIRNQRLRRLHLSVTIRRSIVGTGDRLAAERRQPSIVAAIPEGSRLRNAADPVRTPRRQFDRVKPTALDCRLREAPLLISMTLHPMSKHCDTRSHDAARFRQWLPANAPSLTKDYGIRLLSGS
jgi:hypothetical protein